jgi:tripeptidyl-peptidase-1
MYIVTLLLYAVFFRSTTSNPISSGGLYSVKESHFVPRGWVEVEDAPKNSIINLNIGIKQGNFEELERHLYEGIPVSPTDTY